MGVARTFRDLKVYRLARAAVGEIFEASKTFPNEERYTLNTDYRGTTMEESRAWDQDIFGDSEGASYP
jgi:23S rRNA-intervening sequence protein